MSLDALREYVETRLTDVLSVSHPTLLIKYENVKFTPPSGAAYIANYILDGDSFQASLGNTFIERHVGILQIDIMTPEGYGTKNRNLLADAIGNIFRARGAILEDGSNVVFRIPRVTALGNEGLFDRVAVTFPYHRDERATGGELDNVAAPPIVIPPPDPVVTPGVEYSLYDLDVKTFALVEGDSSSAISLGLTFYVTEDSVLKEIGVYANNGGLGYPNIVNAKIYDTDGTLISVQTGPGLVTTTGWHNITFPDIPLSKDKYYIVAYNTSNGHFSVERNIGEITSGVIVIPDPTGLVRNGLSGDYDNFPSAQGTDNPNYAINIKVRSNDTITYP